CASASDHLPNRTPRPPSTRTCRHRHPHHPDTLPPATTEVGARPPPRPLLPATTAPALAGRLQRCRSTRSRVFSTPSSLTRANFSSNLHHRRHGSKRLLQRSAPTQTPPPPPTPTQPRPPPTPTSRGE
ncbi:unnamed protein product, partial [Ectocarpus sp. 13 AM-2016]